ncbi:selenocysteine-specific translation elongation factor [Luteimonas sp. MC1750]|uniref:selenocysteine-specific translation elongation factor n=1 Tax=Luteimonas sp. MC1750 TaxID=2799326 RepID=UPI0018F0CC11|nr:selenocysteine-specific translation elongation factor [Luteimonas sp. MC1750]MBJ6984416.1 selenocysteine-specific translation elongation factor [Luteimonas sp. MC1750]QQO04966.1 selenocysteine-specific translation elongation factor [Luteimonas sp. MC1750]
MIVGTAGHIDHGKTRLVRALTGVETDRLKEEQARGISIELGYAYAPLPDGGVLGYVDVPGHEKLVHTMAAGACGIDFGLLVVAADDGVMPQTREHLAILGLLGVARGAVAISKADRVDAGRVDQVRADVAALLQDGPLAGAPMFATDAAADGDPGVAALRRHLEHEARTAPGRDAGGLFRLAVDRVFTLPGHGTMVTGTVFGGRTQAGDEGARLVLAPAGTPVRVRSIHAQSQPSPEARAGQRCALNLAGTGRDAIERGDWIADARAFRPTRNLDVELQLLDAAAATLGNWAPVHLHLGTARRLAHAVPLADAGVAPGTTGLVQLVVDEALCAAPGDRFILRDAQASRTIGGGRVLDPEAPTRRRRSPQRLAWLDGIAAMLDGGGLAALLRDAAHGIDEAALVRLASRPPGQLELPPDARWLRPRGGAPIAIADGPRHALQARIEQALADFHRDAPDEPGPEATRLRRIALPTASAALWEAVLDELAAAGRIQRKGPWLHLPGHTVAMDADDAALARRLLAALDAGGFDPPWVRDLARIEDAPEERVRRLLRMLALQGEAHQVVRDLFYHRERMQALAALAVGLACDDGAVAAAGFRDATGLGRKRAIQLLEHFDRTGLTRRVRDSHVVRADSAWLRALGTAADPL